MDQESLSPAAAQHKARPCKFHKVVRLRHAIHMWRKLASYRSGGLLTAESPSASRNSAISASPRVPQGHMAVYVGEERERFVMKTSLLTHPLFKALLRKTEEEIGLNYKGGLSIPCEVGAFKRLLPLMEGKKVAKKKAVRKLKVLPLCDTVEQGSLVDTQDARSDPHELETFHGLLKELMRLHVKEIASYLTSRCLPDSRISFKSSEFEIPQQATCG
ncbi:hypothetical protein KP509_32G072600 [Ceratopteris richardii]|uniref:Uncharacterized protein n=1 Tax=Ceratopteris richardii TaxID=49495 RepID=A0A8T2QV39_CERRI|nr:hypothetical protein KP509_32G072600 [Ceratopteris richardii]